LCGMRDRDECQDDPGQGQKRALHGKLRQEIARSWTLVRLYFDVNCK
jgi:hypothetical protein